MGPRPGHAADLRRQGCGHAPDRAHHRPRLHRRVDLGPVGVGQRAGPRGRAGRAHREGRTCRAGPRRRRAARHRFLTRAGFGTGRGWC
ncbi:hypothetical protein NOCARDAX2BIS_460069 [Nocardioides sp. AX2bis]|nr:hypothetical protein NOCARDAX2BIS_460069 [Nocardioides sp. AX2bis]